GESSAALGKHVPGYLPATEDAINPLRSVAAPAASSSEGDIDGPVADEAVPRNERVSGEVVFRMELVIGRPAETRISSVEPAALLVEQGVTGVEGEAAREAPVDLYLQRM